MAVTATDLRTGVAELSAIHRPSASAGEREAAEWIVATLREIGVPARIEEERVHGEYWSPLALLSGASALAGLAARGRRSALGTAVGALAADHRQVG